MFHETKDKSKDRGRIFVLAFMMIASCVAALGVSTGIPYYWVLQAVTLVVMTAGAFLVIKYTLREYTYELREKKLVVFYIIRGRIPWSLEIPFHEMIAHGYRNSLRDAPHFDKAVDMCYSLFDKQSIYDVYYNDGTKKMRMSFQPSSDLAGMLSAAIYRTKKEGQRG